MRYQIVALLMFSAALGAQTTPPLLSTVDVDFQVHYLGPDTVQAKYGRKLPKTIFAGSVTGTNRGGQNVVFGQGFVLQTLRVEGFSRPEPAGRKSDRAQIAGHGHPRFVGEVFAGRGQDSRRHRATAGAQSGQLSAPPPQRRWSPRTPSRKWCSRTSARFWSRSIRATMRTGSSR